jgi:hypothetical protein
LNQREAKAPTQVVPVLFYWCPSQKAEGIIIYPFFSDAACGPTAFGAYACASFFFVS